MSALAIKIAVGVGASLMAFLLYRTWNSHDYRISTQPQGGSEPRAARCCLCLNDFRNFSSRLNLPCGHPMHRECARLLFEEQSVNSCPYCRRGISREFVGAQFPGM